MTREARKQSCEVSCSLRELLQTTVSATTRIQTSIAWISKLSSNKEATPAGQVSICHPTPYTLIVSLCPLPHLCSPALSHSLPQLHPTVPFLFSDGPELLCSSQKALSPLVEFVFGRDALWPALSQPGSLFSGLFSHGHLVLAEDSFPRGLLLHVIKGGVFGGYFLPAPLLNKDPTVLAGPFV